VIFKVKSTPIFPSLLATNCLIEGDPNTVKKSLKTPSDKLYGVTQMLNEDNSDNHQSFEKILIQRFFSS